ncbi:MAG: beta-ketoacyl-ACP synthase III [candidate division Zixibacteria bacterium]|nr:beta-ketoacyl-ACP synthase III [candidate division Zixibacteria bacterium]
MAHKIKAKIIGTGSFIPSRRMTNADFEKLIDTSDEWIIARTGIKERRIADDNTFGSDMAANACQNAMEMAGCSPEEIDVLIIGTVTPDYRLPSEACVVQEKLGLVNAVAFDIAAACTGFINGLTIARSMIESDPTKKCLVVGCEKLSAITNYKDRGTCVLFGDAAGAVVLAADTNDSGVVSTFMKSDGRLGELLWQEVGGTKNPYTPENVYNGRDKLIMSGSEVFKVAVREMSNASKKVMDDAGITGDDISLVIPHQANIRIIDALAKRLKVDKSKVFINIEKYGNTSSASVPLALDEANRQGRIKPGDYILMVAFGGGLIWGAALVKW